MATTQRAVFAEEDSARAVADRLVRDGFSAQCRPEAFAGEDDDADHAWAVTTDAPEMMLELWCEQYDGWLEAPEVVPESAPIELPTSPIRIKGRASGPTS